MMVIMKFTLGVVYGPEMHVQTLEPDPDNAGVGKGQSFQTGSLNQ